MKTKTLRNIVAAVVIILITIGFVTDWGIGTLSAPGIGAISLLCPLGALATMLASKTVVPRAVISLVIMAVLIIVFARAFCGWVCPVPHVSKLRNIFKKKQPTEKSKTAEVADGEGDAPAQTANIAPLTAEETAALATGCGSKSECKTTAGCASCASQRGKSVDARHWVLGGALVSTLIFGYPVFCLVCPIGLTFATILLVINLFGGGDVTWSLILVPVLLACEVIFFRKWCNKICPMGALMSLLGKVNKTFVPTIDDDKCLETSKGRTCGMCGRACPEGIDVRHPELGEAALNECLKCRECVEACPAHAISMPFLPKKNAKGKKAKATDEPVPVMLEEKDLIK